MPDCWEESASYPLTPAPHGPPGWRHQLLWLPGTTGISSTLSPSSSCPNPLGQEASPIRPGLLQLCPEALDQTHPLGLELKLNQVAIPV